MILLLFYDMSSKSIFNENFKYFYNIFNILNLSLLFYKNMKFYFIIEVRKQKHVS